MQILLSQCVEEILFVGARAKSFLQGCANSFSGRADAMIESRTAQESSVKERVADQWSTPFEYTYGIWRFCGIRGTQWRLSRSRKGTWLIQSQIDYFNKFIKLYRIATFRIILNIWGMCHEFCCLEDYKCFCAFDSVSNVNVRAPRSSPPRQAGPAQLSISTHPRSRSWANQ